MIVTAIIVYIANVTTETRVSQLSHVSCMLCANKKHRYSQHVITKYSCNDWRKEGYLMVFLPLISLYSHL